MNERKGSLFLIQATEGCVLLRVYTRHPNDVCLQRPRKIGCTRTGNSSPITRSQDQSLRTRVVPRGDHHARNHDGLRPFHEFVRHSRKRRQPTKVASKARTILSDDTLSYTTPESQYTGGCLTLNLYSYKMDKWKRSHGAYLMPSRWEPTVSPFHNQLFISRFAKTLWSPSNQAASRPKECSPYERTTP